MANAVHFLKQLGWMLVILALPAAAADITLKPATVRAWNEYVQKAELKVENAGPLKLSTARSTDVAVTPAAGDGTVGVPNGLIHDWIGTTFVPNATLGQLEAVLRDYDHYKDIYTPAVIDSKAIQTGDRTETFEMEWFQKVLSIKTGIDAEYSNTQVRLSRERGYTITRSTRIQEIRKLGQEDEEKLPVDKGSGYIWRICSMLRYEEADGGVYLRLEAIVLSRDIPFGVRWLAKPIVNHLSRNSVAATLTQTGDAVQTRSAKLTGDALAQAR